MENYTKKPAAQLSIHPAKIKGLESHGLCYFTYHDSDFVGAQCSKCNTIVWANAKINKVLNENRPLNIKGFGKEYQEYYFEKLSRFLKSLPKCPKCGSQSFDRFINNVNFPRLQDGTDFDDSKDDIELSYSDANNIQVWLLNEDC